MVNNLLTKINKNKIGPYMSIFNNIFTVKQWLIVNIIGLQI